MTLPRKVGEVWRGPKSQQQKLEDRESFEFWTVIKARLSYYEKRAASAQCERPGENWGGLPEKAPPGRPGG